MAAQRHQGHRVHVVLVPGFGGFDALGQLEYYAGVTAHFRAWQSAAKGHEGTALHYFANLPTAGVATRARRLHRWLATRFARGELLPGDDVVLVGHSTGGLDLRRLLLDLAEGREKRRVHSVDGDHVHYGLQMPKSFTVSDEQLLGLVRKLVFLSVPQRGTNIADWLRAHGMLRRAVTHSARAAVELQRFRGLAWLEQTGTSLAARLTGAQVLSAARDALREADADRAERSARGLFFRRRSKLEAAVRASDAREAWAELLLWTRGVAMDFAAIDDLVVHAPEGGFWGRHFARGAKGLFPSQKDEEKLWRREGIRALSFATVGRRPFEPGVVEDGRRWRLRDGDLLRDPWLEHRSSGESDFVYRFAYRMCAGGPLEDVLAPARATPLEGGPPRELQAWENDGIVNSLSMLWPNGEDTRLVDGDHGDILGHFERVELAQGEERAFHAYDLLGSGSGFDRARFERVWDALFDFAVSPAT